MELSDSSECGLKEDTMRFKEDQCHLFGSYDSVGIPYFLVKKPV
jgi:hypothetical protein